MSLQTTARWVQRHQCALLVGIFVIFLSSSALAAGPAGGDAGTAFRDFGELLWSIGKGLIDYVGKGAMLLGGAWAILAFMGRISHMSTAISIFVAGVFLANLDDLVTYVFGA